MFGTLKIFLPPALIFLLFFGAFQKKIESKNQDLPNFQKVNENFYRGGQPTEIGIKQLAEKGIKTIVNLREEDGKVKQEKALAEKYGMNFFNPHLSNWLKPKNADIEKILEIIRNPKNQPVFIHCKRGADRTGTVTAIYRIKYDGWTEKQAIQEAEKFGFGWWQIWMKDYIEDYTRQNRTK